MTIAPAALTAPATHAAPAGPAVPANTAGLLTGLLDQAAARWPGSAAVNDATGTWTYAELDQAAFACAAWLARQGVGHGDRVVCRVGNVREFVALLFGTFRRGAIFVPVNPEMKPYHLRTVIADAEPALLVTADAETAELTEITAAAGLSAARVAGLSQLRSACVTMETAATTPTPAASAPTPTRTHEPAENAVDPGDVALLIYTSGTTSAPKGVVSPHRAAVFAVGAIAQRLRYTSDDVVLTVIPLAFDYGLYQIFLSVAAGARLTLREPASHVRLLATITEQAVTVIPVVPSLAQMLVRLGARKRGEGLGLVRLLTNTGAALTAPLCADLRATFPNTSIALMFGITECKRVSIAEYDGDLSRPGSSGRPLDGTEVLILDDDERVLPAGEIGEIVVRGPNVMDGYWRAPELTARRFRPYGGEPALRTGDYGKLDADGHLYFQGRRDDMFKRSGLRVSAVEIETAACDVTGVKAAAVLPPAGTRDAVLFVVASVPPAEVLRQLRERIEDGKVPSICEVLDELPLTANGKTDKHALASRLDEQAS
jgi:amino acid adenylation domain-containing protein